MYALFSVVDEFVSILLFVLVFELLTIERKKTDRINGKERIDLLLVEDFVLDKSLFFFDVCLFHHRRHYHHRFFVFY
jgi:hypothetical protein